MVMTRKPDLRVKLGKLELPYPTLMGSGCYGSGEEFASFADLTKIGGVVLKSVTRLPRIGNPTPRLVHTPARHAQRDRIAKSRHRLVSRARGRKVCRHGRAR